MVDLGSPRPIGDVAYAPPEVSVVPDARPAAAGHGLVRVCFRLRLDGGARRVRFIACYLRVAFDDPAVCATELWAGTAPDLGVPTSVSTLPTGAVGWLVGDPVGTDPIPEDCLAHAVVQLPTTATTLAGTLRADASAIVPARVGNRRDHASSVRAHRFAVPLPTGWSEIVRPISLTAPVPTNARPAAVRLCYAADIEKFRRFEGAAAQRAQTRFFDVLAAARRRTGVSDHDVELQHAGDGQFAVLPSGVDESTVVPAFIEGLRSALRETNADLNEHARLRLRVALHRGHVAPGDGGASGEIPVAVHRLLDSRELRTALADGTDSDLALIVPDVLYQEIVRHRYGNLDPDGFTATQATLPDKDFTAHAWIHLSR
ncbi:hypothetical protein [Actinokineospora enzanensis]|uniref:hypothetical protein n=1 Tax=Actinokineospora enzanensis TaxID=155975 RepID=UPI00035CC24E|nr:hypothetical protein [Actinokineospora enzanensis]